MVNQVVLAVGLGLVAGFVVVIIYFMVQFIRNRSVNNEYKYKKLTSDPAYGSRAVIKQDIPPFYIPQSVPVQLQQPIRSERSGSISKDDYRNGHSLLSATVHSVNVKGKAEDRGTGIQLNAINTGPLSPPLTPRSLKPPRKISPTKKQLPQKENLSLPQHRKVAVYKKFPDSNLGKLEFSLYYDQSFRLLQIYVIRGIKIASSEDNVPPDVLVIASLSFSKNQIWEQKTRMVKNSNDPQFNEKLEAHGITSAKLHESTLRFQLFNDGANTIIGEVEYSLKELPANKLTSQILPLVPVEIDETYCNIEEAIPVSPSELGELSISLCHNPTDQKLTVKLNCARALQPITKDGRLNPFVKLEVTFCGRKLSSRTTKTAHNTLTPNFSEVFVFDMHSDKLPQVTLMFKVKHRGRMRDVSIGTVHLGYCVNVESEYKHWEQVMEKPHLEIEQWHPIQDYFVE
ncbi:synaptotagmin-7-like [Orbicella faveolata]|uniref:synaptotagmin-7-like n=1 Tax=Orbicella faveolata TaxID=48498 RepID=UPI0009E45199|nr:synaptotagmin-7-like [Orbicella faveolata]